MLRNEFTEWLDDESRTSLNASGLLWEVSLGVSTSLSAV